jgi:glyoxylase I family protein
MHHIAFNCRDRRALEVFYTKHFGFTRARVFNEGKPGEFVMLRRGPMCIELFDAKPKADGAGGEQEIGFKHIAFEVESIPDVVDALKADGVTPDPIIDAGAAVPGLTICFFRDPEGNIVELMHGWRDQEFR